MNIFQAAGECYNSAQTAKNHWEKALSHQRSLSHQLQENFETLAQQMHGLEAEATKASKQGMNINHSELDESYQLLDGSGPPSLDTESGGGSTPSSIRSINSIQQVPLNGTKPPGTVQRLNKNTKKEVSFNIPSSPSPEPTLPLQTGPSILVTSNDQRSNSPDEEEVEMEDDDDQFYDAEEGSDLPDSENLSLGKKSLHRRTESSISMNDSLMCSPPPNTVPPENLPTCSSGGTMLVSPLIAV